MPSLQLEDGTDLLLEDGTTPVELEGTRGAILDADWQVTTYTADPASKSITFSCPPKRKLYLAIAMDSAATPAITFSSSSLTWTLLFQKIQTAEELVAVYTVWTDARVTGEVVTVTEATSVNWGLGIALFPFAQSRTEDGAVADGGASPGTALTAALTGANAPVDTGSFLMAIFGVWDTGTNAPSAGNTELYDHGYTGGHASAQHLTARSVAGTDATIAATSSVSTAWASIGWEVRPYVAITAHELGGTLARGRTLSGELSKLISLQGTVSRGRTLAGSPSLTKSLAGTLSRARTLAGPLAVVVKLSGTLTRARALSGQLVLVQFLSGTELRGRTFAGAVLVRVNLAGTEARGRTLAGSPTTGQQHLLSGMLPRARVLAGELQRIVNLAGSLARVRAVAGSPILRLALSGTIARARSFAGDPLIKQIHLISGTLPRVRVLAGTPTLLVKLSGQLARSRNLAGSPVRAATLSGNLTRSRVLAGSPQRRVGLSGILTRSRALQAELGMVRNLAGILVRGRTLEGELFIGVLILPRATPGEYFGTAALGTAGSTATGPSSGSTSATSPSSGTTATGVVGSAATED